MALTGRLVRLLVRASLRAAQRYTMDRIADPRGYGEWVEGSARCRARRGDGARRIL